MRNENESDTVAELGAPAQAWCDTSMPSEQYHKHPSMSKTKLDLFARDENLLEWYLRCPVDEDKLKTLDFGDAMHAICLEPDRLRSEFAVMPPLNLRTNAGRAEKEAFELENAHKRILTADEYKKLQLMFESVMAHPSARRIIEANGMAEHSFFWTDRESGVACRCRPDKVIETGGFAADVKTTPELSKFMYSIEDYRYYVQDPFYLDGLASNGIPLDEMRFLVIQKNIEAGRYPVMVVTLPQEVVEYGRKVYRENLQAYAEFVERQEFRPTQEIEMHHWFINKIQDNTIEGIH